MGNPTNDNQQRSLSDQIAIFFPLIRHAITAASAVAITVGVMSSDKLPILMDAWKHISADLKDMLFYMGVAGSILAPIWGQLASRVVPLLRSLNRRDPSITVVAPDAIAQVTPQNVLSSSEVEVVAKKPAARDEPPSKP